MTGDEQHSMVSLREHITQAVKQEREMRELQIAEMKSALILARQVQDQRLEGMNELRDQITRERGSYLSRELFEKLHDALEIRVRHVEAFKSNIDGRIMMVGVAFTLLQLAIGVMIYVLKG